MGVVKIFGDPVQNVAENPLIILFQGILGTFLGHLRYFNTSRLGNFPKL